MRAHFDAASSTGDALADAGAFNALVGAPLQTHAPDRPAPLHAESVAGWGRGKAR